MKASEGARLVTDVQIGARLRVVRAERRLSQADVARRLGVIGVSFHQAQVARVESGDRPLRATEVVAFARVLDVAPAWLLGEGDPAKPGGGPGEVALAAEIGKLLEHFYAEAVEREGGDDGEHCEAP